MEIDPHYSAMRNGQVLIPKITSEMCLATVSRWERQARRKTTFLSSTKVCHARFNPTKTSKDFSRTVLATTLAPTQIQTKVAK